jgi:hypothetical protein
VVLAADALAAATPAGSLFLGEGLPEGFALDEDVCDCLQRSSSGRNLAQD